MRLWLLFSFLFLLTSRSDGQTYSFSHYDTKDGLAGSTVHGIVQSRDGFLWFATETGLSRFDGIRFRNFSMADGLPSNEIFGCFLDGKDRIWLTPFKKSVCYYENGKIHNQDNDSLLKKIRFDDFVKCISESASGDIIMVGNYETHILTYDNQIIELPVGLNRRLTPVLHPYRIITDNNYLVSSIVDMPDVIRKQINPLWIFISQIVEKEVTYYIFRYLDSFYMVSEEGCKEIVLSTYRNPVMFLNDHEYVLLDDVKGAEIINLENPKRSSRYFKDYLVQCVFRDKEQNLWFSTKGSGVLKVSANRFKNLFPESENGTTNIIDIRKIGTHIYVGGYSEKYWRFNSVDDLFFHKDIPNPPVPFLADEAFLHKMPYGMLMNAGSSNFLNLPQFAPFPTSIGAIKTIQFFGDTLLIACTGGAFLVNRKEQKRLECLLATRATCAYKSDSVYYIGTFDGLYEKKHGGSPQFIGDRIPELKKEISSFALSDDGTLWVGTNGGGVVGYRNGKVCTVLNKSKGLVSDLCRCLFVAGNKLWVGTEKGLNKVVIGPGKCEVKATITTNDGLNSNIVNAIFNDSDFVYVGTPIGLTVFDQRNIQSHGICDLNMTGITVSGRMLDPRENDIVLAHEDNNISFEYSGISFLSGGDMTYKYRIVGLNDEWKTTKESVLTYPSLPSGKYILELIALNKFEEESKVLRYHFKIEKSIPETLWFKISMAFLSVLIISLIVYMIIQAAQKKRNEKMMVDHKIKSLEQMALRAQMSPHFIFNCLNSLQQYILHGDIKKVNFYLGRFAGLVRDTLNNATKVYISVEQELKYLNTYIDLERLQHSESFDCVIEVDPEIDLERTKIPNMVLQPYIENAIKHGVSRIPGQGKLLIRFILLREEQLLTCVVEDNGPGIAASGRGNALSKTSSKGMSITDKRIVTLNELNPQSAPIRLQVIDISTLGTGTGTKIIIHFPI